MFTCIMLLEVGGFCAYNGSQCKNGRNDKSVRKIINLEMSMIQVGCSQHGTGNRSLSIGYEKLESKSIRWFHGSIWDQVLHKWR